MAERDNFLWDLLAAIDRRDRGYYDQLSAEDRKKFSAYMALRWMSYVDAGPDVQSGYVQLYNHYANKNIFLLSRHPKLQWYMLIAASPGLGRQRHSWPRVKKSKETRRTKTLRELFPGMKTADAEVLDQLITDADIKQYHRDLGHDKT